MSHPKTLSPILPDPYFDVPEHLCSRLGARIFTPDFLIIHHIRPKRGCTQDTVATFFHSLAQKCRELGITNYTEYEQYATLISLITYHIAGITTADILAHRGGTPPIPNPETQSRENRRGTTLGHPALEERDVVVTNPQSDGTGRLGHSGGDNNVKGRKGKKGGTGKGKGE